MKSERILLLKTLLLSSSIRNTLKNSTDKDKRKKAIGRLVGMGAIYFMLAVYAGLAAFGLCIMGMGTESITLLGLLISLIAFVFTIFKTNGYMFNFKEYDVLMSLPFSVKTIVADRFLYMYIKSFPIFAVMAVPVIAVYAIMTKASLLGIFLSVPALLFAPMIPMVLSMAVGVLIARMGTGFKHKRLAITVLTFVLVLPMFCISYIIEAFAKNRGTLENALSGLSNSMFGAEKYYLPAKWFERAITQGDVLSLLLLIVTSLVFLEVASLIVSGSYRKINSSMRTDASHGKVKAKSIRQRSCVQSIAYNEFKKFLGSTNYSVNAGMGQVICIVLSIVSLFLGFDKLLSVITKGAPLEVETVISGIPFLVYLLVGMVSSTCISPSLEGKNYWIVQSLPISPLTLYKGKMLFNLYLSIPFAIFGNLCLCISAKAGGKDILINTLVVIAMCLFSTTFGLVCGIKHMKLDWENDIEVIKQGTAVVIYLFPNLVITCLLMVGMCFLRYYADTTLAMLLTTFVFLLLAGLFYLWVVKLSKKKL